jgi:spore germination protein YaaH
MRAIALPFIIFLTTLFVYGQEEVTVTIGYPDDEGYFVYSIPPTDEHARFGGIYYLKIENTGNVTIDNWKLATTWKTINSTWGVVEKTVINASEGQIELTGPSWDTSLDPGEEVVVSGEWIPVTSVEDWIDFLPREMSFSGNNHNIVIDYDTDGIENVGTYNIEKVKPINSDRKTFSNLKSVAYFPTFDYEGAWCSLQKYGENIDQLRIQMYTVSPEGLIQSAPDEEDAIPSNLHYWYDKLEALGVMQYCVDHNIEIVPVIFNYSVALNDFDQSSVNTMLNSASIKQTHMASIVQLLNDKPGLDGIDVDYESLLASDNVPYALFMEELADEVHGLGKILTTAVHTKVGPGTWYGPKAQDIERLGNAVDEILFMTYDLHWGTSPTYSSPPPTAGCQSTADWMNDVAFFGVSEIIDPSKVQLGIPFYGYRWIKDFENHTVDNPGVGMTHQEAIDLIDEHNVTQILREGNSQEPYFYVEIDGVEWVCYFQDDISLENKLTALDEHDLKDYIGGIGIWRLGQESDAMWDAISQKLNNQSATIDATVEDCETDPVDVSVEEHENDVQISLYPNPANDYVTVHGSTEIKDFEILDMTGKVLKKGTYQSQIDVHSLASGEYFIRLLFANNNVTKRFSKL